MSSDGDVRDVSSDGDGRWQCQTVSSDAGGDVGDGGGTGGDGQQERDQLETAWVAE